MTESQKIKMLKYNLQQAIARIGSQTAESIDQLREDDLAALADAGFAKPARREQIMPITLLIGAHRSGTSFLAKVLSVTGQDLGRSLMLPSFDNPRGFWENQKIVAVHEGILKTFDKDWTTANFLPKNWSDSPAAQSAVEQIIDILETDFDERDPTLIKDPRICIFLPIWERVAEVLGRPLKKVLIVRSPESIAASLHRRNGLELIDGRLNALTYLATAMSQLSDLDSVLIYEKLIGLDGYNLLLELTKISGRFDSVVNTNLVNQIDQIIRGDRRQKALSSPLHNDYLKAVNDHSDGLTIAELKPFIRGYLQRPEYLERTQSVASQPTLLPKSDQTVSIPKPLYDTILSENHEAEILQSRLVELEAYLRENIADPQQLDEVLGRDRFAASGNALTQQSAQQMKKGRAAIIASDLSSTEAARAASLYDLLSVDWDVELIAPIWQKNGSKIWTSIEKSWRNIRLLECKDLRDFYPKANIFAQSNHYNLALISKPSVPAFALGAMIKNHSDCPIVLDIDDQRFDALEDDETPPKYGKSALRKLLKTPFTPEATQICRELIHEFDGLCVSNSVLQQAYGGAVIRHARDENLFNPELYDRKIARKKMGLTDRDFCILYAGSTDEYKGLRKVAETLDEMDDDRFVLCVVGDVEPPQLQSDLESLTNARVLFFPPCRFDELPHYLSGADVVPALLDDEHNASHFEVPSKISDALSFGVPVVATELRPLYDLETLGYIDVIHPDYFADTLLELYELQNTEDAEKKRSHRRLGFETEMSYRINRVRLDNVIQTARRKSEPLKSGLVHLLASLDETYREMADPRVKRLIKPRKGKKDLVIFSAEHDAFADQKRSEKFAEHFLDSNKFGRILEFGAPINFETLAASLRISGVNTRNVTEEFRLKYHQDDTERLFKRRFFWSDHQSRPAFIDGTTTDVYPAYIMEQMEAMGLVPENTVAWISLPVFSIPNVAAQVPFDSLVLDISDATFNIYEQDEAVVERLNKNLSRLLPKADCVLTSRAIDSLGHDVQKVLKAQELSIHLVPNGTDIPGDVKPYKALKSLKSPIAGFVGHTFDAIDWELLTEAAYHASDFTFVVAANGMLNSDIKREDLRENIKVMENISPEKFDAFIAAFDVCILPYLTGLKGGGLTTIYSYFASQKSIVVTEVQDIDHEMTPFIQFAKNGGEFATLLKASLEAPKQSGKEFNAVLQAITWEARGHLVSEILENTVGLSDKAKPV